MRKMLSGVFLYLLVQVAASQTLLQFHGILSCQTYFQLIHAMPMLNHLSVHI